MAVTKKERRNKMLIVVFGTIILAGLYFYLVNKDAKKAQEVALSERVENIIGSDIEMDYPSTPREVIILNNEITTCFYGEDLDDDTLKKLVLQQRVLFDEALLEENPLEKQLEQLKEEILDYQKTNRKIITSAVAKSSSVKYWSDDGKEYASIIASFTLKDSEVSKSNEKFILRKDDNGKWRIFGWQIVASTDGDE